MSDERPPRVTLTNIETAEVLSAQFNPEQVDEEITPNYNRLPVMGLSHEPLQYKNTSNLVIGPVDFAFDAISVGGGVARIADARRFLHSLCYSRRGSADVAGGGPPRVLLSWPRLYSIVCRLTKLRIGHKRFLTRSLQPVLFTATVSIEEARVVRLFSEEVRAKGTRR